MVKLSFLLTCIFLFFVDAKAQNYKFTAQQKLIPKLLGSAYLGMPLNSFLKGKNITNHSVDTLFGYITLNLPYKKDGIKSLILKTYQHDTVKLENNITAATVKTIDGFDEEILILNKKGISKSIFIYEIYIAFENSFDIDNFVVKQYGKQFSVDNEQNKLYDKQWYKKTYDGLEWLIRSYKSDNNKALMLAGRIKGTEWEVDLYQ